METARPETVTRTALSGIVNEVLGNLAFMIGEEAPPAAAARSDWLQSEIHYYGPYAGGLRCWCTPKTAVQLAAALLGSDPDESEAQAAAEDACREFINVLCGQVVTAWYGSEAVFGLTIPTVNRGAAAAPLPGGAAAEFCAISVAGEPFYCLHAAEAAA